MEIVRVLVEGSRPSISWRKFNSGGVGIGHAVRGCGGHGSASLGPWAPANLTSRVADVARTWRAGF